MTEHEVFDNHADAVFDYYTDELLNVVFDLADNEEMSDEAQGILETIILEFRREFHRAEKD